MPLFHYGIEIAHIVKDYYGRQVLNSLGEDEEHDSDNDRGAERRQIATDAHLFVDSLAQLINFGFQL